MHYTWIALTIGLAGSLHCVGMCGPLVSALHVGAKGFRSKTIWYHSGRALGYAVLGAIMGLVGYSMSLVVTQQWLAMIAGLTMIASMAWPTKWRIVPRAFASWMHHIRQRYMQWWQNGNSSIAVIMGILNAWLPCGLVYTALAASVVTASPLHGAIFMALFGLANTPALLMSTGLMRLIQVRFGNKKNVQVFLMVFALLIALRGAGLGIPYVSPNLHHTSNSCCHP
jgi:sulfite exporter TauE/SafE